MDGIISIGKSSKEKYNTMVILIIMYIGIDKCISYSFYQIIKLLYIDLERKRRTNIVINLGRKFIRLLRTIKIGFNKNLEEIYLLKDLKSLVTILMKQDYFG
jgi:hypothetical protein